MALTNVTLVGANGTLGPSVLSALLSESRFNVTVISRASSKSTYPASVKEIRVPDSMPRDALVSALQGADALITTFGGSLTSTAIQLADAALEAGVKRFIPADFGSCDSSDERSLALVPLYGEKKRMREYLDQLSTKSDGRLTWTSLITGHFLDHGLHTTLLGFDIENGKATIFDGGDVRFSSSTLARIGEATAKVLEHEKETRNKIVYVQSLSTTQNEIKATIERVTGKKLTVEDWKSDEYIKVKKEALAKDEKNGSLVEDLVAVEGIVNAKWERKPGFSNKLLGLDNQILEDVVKKALGEKH